MRDPLDSIRQLIFRREAERYFIARLDWEMNGGLRVGGSGEMEGDGYLFREPKEHALAVPRVREVEPLCDHGFVRNALGAVVNWGFEHVEVSHPHGVFLLRAWWIQVLHH